MFGTKFGLAALLAAVLALSAAPIAIGVGAFVNDGDDDNPELVTVTGEVTAYLYDDDEDQNDMNDEKNRPSAFVIDDEVIVEFGPWWYWMVQETSVLEVVQVGDQVNVTGEMEALDDGTQVLCAWTIADETDPDDIIVITIREEGKPPWAGGPKALGIDPWPPSDEDE